LGKEKGQQCGGKKGGGKGFKNDYKEKRWFGRRKGNPPNETRKKKKNKEGGKRREETREKRRGADIDPRLKKPGGGKNGIIRGKVKWEKSEGAICTKKKRDVGEKKI